MAEGNMRADADELVRTLILNRYAEKYEGLPYSAGHHILHCETLTVTDVSHEEGVVGGVCGTCECVTFVARVSCEHASDEFDFAAGSGRLDVLIRDLAELAE